MRLKIILKPEVTLSEEDSKFWIDEESFREIGTAGMFELADEDPTAMLEDMGSWPGFIERIEMVP